MVEFFLLEDPNVRWVVLAMILMCGSSALIGTFAFLQKKSLVGDAISHAILPGIALSFLITGVKSPAVLLIGAFLSGWLALWMIDQITMRSKIKPDAALALVMSVMYGVGILLMTHIQASGSASQSGLDKFLFGKAAAMMQEDVMVYGTFAFVLIILVAIYYKNFKVTLFDRQYAKVIGLDVVKTETILSVMTVFAIAIGIQAVGVVLMSALLITPAAAARYWTHQLKTLLVLATIFAIISGIGGAYISYELPKMPTGPWVVVLVSFITLISVVFGTQKGLLSVKRKRMKQNDKMLTENILKALYHLGEKSGDLRQVFTFRELLEKREFPNFKLLAGLRKLYKKGFLSRKKGYIALTEEGVVEAQRIVRLHRLWEVFLYEKLGLSPEQVHDEAEAMEHILTPELEAELDNLLDYPMLDPHNEPIPRSSK